MSPELITAIKERIDLGHTEEAIRSELEAAGYDEQTIHAAYTAAQANGPLTQATGAATSSNTQLPGVIELFKSSFAAVAMRLDLLLLMIAPQLAFVIVMFLTVGTLDVQEEQVATLGLGLTIVIAVILLVIASVVVSLAVLRSITMGNQQFSIGQALSWALKNFLSFLWVSILIIFAVYGGLLLLIVPAIIVSILLAFAQFVFVVEGRRGLDALLRSRQLVIGRWWAVFGRLLGFGLLTYLVVIIPLGIASGLLGVFIGEGEAVFSLVSQVAGSVVGLVVLFGMYRLYTTLVAAKPGETFVPTEARDKYVILAWLGAALPILMIVLSVVLASLKDARDQGLQAQEMMKESAIDAKENAAKLRVDNEANAGADKQRGGE